MLGKFNYYEIKNKLQNLKNMLGKMKYDEKNFTAKITQLVLVCGCWGGGCHLACEDAGNNITFYLWNTGLLTEV